MDSFTRYINNYNLGISDIMHNIKYPADKGVVDVYIYVNNQGVLSVNIGEPTFDTETTVYFHSRYKLSKEEYIDEETGEHQLDDIITNYYVDDVYETEEPMYLIDNDLLDYGDDEGEEKDV